MPRGIGTGVQNFSQLRERNSFFVDKTDFIKDWWNADDAVTLITRPRRFGKTLNMSMLECFFSPEYTGRNDLFEGLSVWDDAEMRELQGSQPTIFITFAAIKGTSYDDFLNQMNSSMLSLYSRYEEFVNGSELIPSVKKDQFNLMHRKMIDILVKKDDNKADK